MLTYDDPPDPGMAAVTGGYVVRDPAMPNFAGRYLWADFFVGEIHSVTPKPPPVTDDNRRA
jgi:hypothetical protein